MECKIMIGRLYHLKGDTSLVIYNGMMFILQFPIEDLMNNGRSITFGGAGKSVKGYNHKTMTRIFIS